jgi:hypothetical protein
VCSGDASSFGERFMMNRLRRRRISDHPGGNSQPTHLESSSKISSNVALRYHDSVPSSPDTATSSDDVAATPLGPLLFFFGAAFFRGAFGFGDDKGTGNSKTLRPFGFSDDGVDSCLCSTCDVVGCIRFDVLGESNTLLPDPEDLIGGAGVACCVD